MTVARGQTFDINPRPDGLVYMDDLSTGGDPPPDPPPPDPPEGSYDLGTLPGYVADILWPNPPVITSTSVAGSIGDLQAAIQIAGRQVTIAPGLNLAPGSCIFDGASDVEVICPNDSTINGAIEFGNGSRPQRISWTGGNVNGPVGNGGADDILVNNLRQLTEGAGAGGPQDGFNNWTGGPGGWSRVAIINSTFEMFNGNGGGDWVLFAGTVTGQNRNNMILANLKLINNGGQTCRFQDIDKLVCVDFHFNATGNAVNGIRMHTGCTEMYFRNGIIVGAGIGSSTIQVATGDWVDIDRYHTINNSVSQPLTTVTNFGCENVTHYWAGTLTEPLPLGQGIDRGGNGYAFWNELNSTLPVSSVGANH